jgi:hypothetical protein
MDGGDPALVVLGVYAFSQLYMYAGSILLSLLLLRQSYNIQVLFSQLAAPGTMRGGTDDLGRAWRKDVNKQGK